MAIDLFVLDKDFVQVGLIDEYESFIWTDRYNEPGDFEIYTSPFSKAYQFLKEDYYLIRPDSEHVMIIEEIEITTDSDNGPHLKVTGRSLESILSRRIVWGQKSFEDKTVKEIIETLLNENIISPAETNRQIPNFTYHAVDIPDVTNQVLSLQYTGDSLDRIISDICSSYGIGYKVTLNSNNQFVFELYQGLNRTYAQTNNPYVLFSPRFDNIINSDYLQSQKSLRNVALVLGEEKENSKDRKSIVVYGNQPAGTPYNYLKDGVWDTSVLSNRYSNYAQRYAVNNGSTIVANGYFKSDPASGRTTNDDTESIFWNDTVVPRNQYDSMVVKLYYTGRAAAIQDYQKQYEPRVGIAATRDSSRDPNFIASGILNTVSSALQTLECSLAPYNSQNADGYLHLAGIGSWKVVEISFVTYLKTGIDRRELFVDARDLSSSTYDDVGEEHSIPPAQYNNQMSQRGVQQLASCPIVKQFDGKVEASQLFIYGRDFYMGDIIQIENEFGIEGTARITEFIYSDDRSGIQMYPTFTAIN